MRLYSKLLLILLTVAALSVGGLWRYSRRAVTETLVAERRARAEEAAATEMPSWRVSFAAPSERRLLPRLEDSLQSYDARYAAALDAEGRVLAHTNVIETGRLEVDAFTRLAAAAPEPSSRLLTADGEPVLEVSLPVWTERNERERFLLGGTAADGARRLGTRRLGRNLRRVLAERDRIALQIGSVICLGAGVTLGLLFLFVQGILAPVRRLALGVEKLARGERGTQVPVTTSDEVGDLARGFNRMSEDLARTTVSRDYLTQILHATQDALFVADASWRVAMVNPAACALTGWSEKELLGRPVTRLFEADSGGLALREQNRELALKTRSGATIPVLFSSAPMEEPGRGVTGLVCAAKDITDRKRAEEAEAARERERIQKEFVATVSHELRTPITAIKGFAETLLHGGLDDAENREGFVKTIDRNATRLAQLVENLLTLSVLETGRRRLNPETLELDELIFDFVPTLEPLAQRSCVDISLNLEPGLRVTADRHQLPQILQNLIDNAIKFSRRGGAVSIEARRAGGEAVVSVTDSGIGIAASDLPTIFERFRRAEAEGARKIRGTGLGLSITKQLVELHGGRLWVESVQGQGASFRFTLPLSVPAAESAPASV